MSTTPTPPEGAKHDLYTDFDADAPDVIKDRNGEVCLAMCKICRLGESQLDETPVCPGPKEGGKLLPCPFCGGEAEIWRAGEHPTRNAWIACLGRCAVMTKEHPSDDLAIAAWNTRADQWQPIETAPKDGKPVDLWLNGEFPHRRAYCFWSKPPHICGEAGQYCDCCPKDEPVWNDVFGVILENPTHWMPLPAPPRTAP